MSKGSCSGSSQVDITMKAAKENDAVTAEQYVARRWGPSSTRRGMHHLTSQQVN